MPVGLNPPENFQEKFGKLENLWKTGNTEK
jgi:hypothetical protein